MTWSSGKNDGQQNGKECSIQLIVWALFCHATFLLFNFRLQFIHNLKFNNVCKLYIISCPVGVATTIGNTTQNFTNTIITIYIYIIMLPELASSKKNYRHKDSIQKYRYYTAKKHQNTIIVYSTKLKQNQYPVIMHPSTPVTCICNSELYRYSETSYWIKETSEI